MPTTTLLPPIDESNEIWKPIPSTNGVFEASNQGRIRRTQSAQGAKMLNHPRLGTNKSGYREVQVQCKQYGVSGLKFVHQLVLEAFIGPKPTGHECNHKNGNRSDNRLDNLEWVTRRENVLHAYRVLGRYHLNPPHGSQSGTSKLTEEYIPHIRARVRQGESQASVARSLGVSRTTIILIMQGKTWRHVPDDPTEAAKLRHPKILRGSENGQAKFSEADIPTIRSRVRRGERHRDVAKDFGVGKTAITDIMSGRTWAHVPDQHASLAI